MELICNFKAAAKPKPYGNEGKTLTNFYVDIDKDSNYPSMAEFTIFGDKTSLSGIKEGDAIVVHFNISGRKTEWTDKDGKKKSGFFQTLKAWKVEKVAEEAASVPDNFQSDGDLPF